MNPLRFRGHAGKACSLGIAFLGLGLWLTGAQAHPLDVWHERFGPSPLRDTNFLGVAYGKDLFVAVGTAGNIFTAPTGEKWWGQVSPTTQRLDSVCHGNGTFVAVGMGGAIVSSPDGTNWTLRAAGTNAWLHRVQYGNGVFVAVGDGQVMLASADGATWTQINPGATFSPWFMTCGNGLFLVQNSPGKNLVSANGTNWYTLPSASTNGQYIVGFGGKRFVSIDIRNDVFTSPDGTNWTRRGHVELMRPSGIAFGSGYMVIVGGGSAEYSDDAANWRVSPGGYLYVGSAVAYGQNTFVAVGGQGYIRQTDPVIRLEQVVPGTLSLAASENELYEIQGSEDFSKSDGGWQALARVSFEASPFLWIDSTRSNTPQRFYRVLLKSVPSEAR
jgi:hypothetical protein